ncbi:MAG: hypothetical protein GX264_00395 [Clostridiales bacterium]|nr:hypothetical protein [Clostridiales bacterium]
MLNLLSLAVMALEINTETVMTSLGFMWKGMLGIMTVIIIITVIVMIMARIDSKKAAKNEGGGK